ncbi:lipopolysaccharide biosynthesis protein [Microbacterium sp. K41]|uniref:lipopolysaccharide biosynthesis protein n=1 Tax=Microbacterium sp. K41 TaxID=2305437 RepID=UPI00109C6884|nr:oligosaccharide flippase family protein [Microbacterium sp. K41]
MRRVLRLISSGVVSRAGRTTLWSFGNVALATVVGVITARLLGVDLRGVLGIFVSVAGLVVLVGTWGTNVAIRRLLPRGEISAKQYLQVSAFLFLFHVLLLLLVVWGLSVLVDTTFAEPVVFFGFLAYGAAYFWSNQLLDLMNASGLMSKSAATNALGTAVCMAALVVAALAGAGLGGVVLCYFVSMLAQIGIGIVTLRHSFGGVAQPGARGHLLRLGPKLLGLNLGQAIAYRADTALIGALGSAGAAGIYAVATTPASVLTMPATALSQVVMHDAAARTISFRGILRRVFGLMAALAVLVVVGWLLADLVIAILFGPDFAEAAGVLRVLLLAQLLLVPFIVFSRVVVACGATWSASLPGIVGAVTLVGLGVVLIPGLGAFGGAWASVCAYAAMSLVSFVQVFRYRDTLRTPASDDRSTT